MAYPGCAVLSFYLHLSRWKDGGTLLALTFPCHDLFLRLPSSLHPALFSVACFSVLCLPQGCICPGCSSPSLSRIIPWSDLHEVKAHRVQTRVKVVL